MDSLAKRNFVGMKNWRPVCLGTYFLSETVMLGVILVLLFTWRSRKASTGTPDETLVWVFFGSWIMVLLSSVALRGTDPALANVGALTLIGAMFAIGVIGAMFVIGLLVPLMRF
jgi:hypothetical protein